MSLAIFSKIQDGQHFFWHVHHHGTHTVILMYNTWGPSSLWTELEPLRYWQTSAAILYLKYCNTRWEIKFSRPICNEAITFYQYNQPSRWSVCWETAEKSVALDHYNSCFHKKKVIFWGKSQCLLDWPMSIKCLLEWPFSIKYLLVWYPSIKCLLEWSLSIKCLLEWRVSIN